MSNSIFWTFITFNDKKNHVNFSTPDVSTKGPFSVSWIKVINNKSTVLISNTITALNIAANLLWVSIREST